MPFLQYHSTFAHYEEVWEVKKKSCQVIRQETTSGEDEGEKNKYLLKHIQTAWALCIYKRSQRNVCTSAKMFTDNFLRLFVLWYLSALTATKARWNVRSQVSLIIVLQSVVYVWLIMFMNSQLLVGESLCFKLKSETSGNQASCSMRLLRKQLHCTLPEARF